MSDGLRRTRLETQAIVLGYAMSRLDERYLLARNRSTWNEVFEEAASVLTIQPASLKNLRDEFDPFHGNHRKGWHRRPLRSSRQRVLDDLHGVSDDALLEMVARILGRDESAIIEAIDSLAEAPRTAHNVAERLLTGRRAEEFFMANSERIMSVTTADLLDCRLSACGFDFGISGRPDEVVEVKGLKQGKGEILFTDREWVEAKYRRDHYWLVVIGNLATEPRARVIRDPHENILASCDYQVSVNAVWRSKVDVL